MTRYVGGGLSGGRAGIATALTPRRCAWRSSGSSMSGLQTSGPVTISDTGCPLQNTVIDVHVVDDRPRSAASGSMQHMDRTCPSHRPAAAWVCCSAAVGRGLAAMPGLASRYPPIRLPAHSGIPFRIAVNHKRVPSTAVFAAPARCQRSRNSGIRRAAAAGNPSAVVTSASLGMVALTLTRGSEEFFGRRNRASGPSWIAGYTRALSGRPACARATCTASRSPPRRSTRPASTASVPVHTLPRATASISATGRPRPCATLATKSS